MAKKRKCCFISPGFVIEINILLLAVGIIFLVDLYNHVNLHRRKLSDLDMSIRMLGLSTRISWLRGICLVVYLYNSLLGIRMSRHPSISKFGCYMLIGFILLLFTISITLSRYQASSNFGYYSNMMLHSLWVKTQIESIEALFDCCGIHGPIDYTIANRSWSKSGCCELSQCDGCEYMFRDYLVNIEMEIARDNIALSIFLAIGMALMALHYQNAHLVDDPYDSEEEEFEKEEEIARNSS